MRVEVKDVATPSAATAAKGPGASEKSAAPRGNHHTAAVLRVRREGEGGTSRPGG